MDLSINILKTQVINKKIKGNAGQNNNAFSLIELSIVILIISILASSGLTIFKSTNATSKIKTTKDRMDAVYEAIGNYLLVNRRLPCPARLDLNNTDTDTDYGISKACINESGVIIASSPNNNLAYGMVPTKTLGLPSSMAEDAFGTKFSYIIDTRFATVVNAAGTTGFEGSDPLAANMIQIQDSSSTILSNVIMVIISHGPNKLGGFNSAGTVKNDTTGIIVPDENNNIIRTLVNPNDFNTTFYAGSNNTAFDDILIFKNKTQLAIDADLESMLCRKAEATNYTTTSPCSIITFTWNKDANYGEKKNNSTGASCPAGCTPTNIPARVCGKYGIWGPVLYQCI